MARIYRPRALLRLTIPLPDASGDEYEPFTYDVDVRRVRLERNDHNHADALQVEVDWIDAGVDPRWIAGGTCELYLGAADEYGAWEPSDDNLRFVGRMVKPARQASAESLRVTLDFHDYTSFFLVAKPVSTDGTPLYSDNLQQAWERLCSVVPGVEALKDNLRFVGVSTPPLIGSAVSQRFRTLGQVPVKPNSDAWAIWQQVVGMCGLIGYFEYDQCVVSTATDFYTATSTPRLLWGRNILEFSERRNNDRGLRGVGITSFDPLTGTSLESIYDPLAGKRKAHKPPAKAHSKKTKRATKPKVDQNPEIDFFQYPGVTDQARLDEIARRVYEERSRQELEGTVVTCDMDAETTNADEFDLLTLSSGDTIEVRFLDSDDADFVKQIQSRSDRVNYLVAERGYTPQVAQIVAANVENMTAKSNLFYVKSAVTELETDESGGKFRVSIEFINKIDIDGGPAAA